MAVATHASTALAQTHSLGRRPIVRLRGLLVQCWRVDIGVLDDQAIHLVTSKTLIEASCVEWIVRDMYTGRNPFNGELASGSCEAIWLPASSSAADHAGSVLSMLWLTIAYEYGYKEVGLISIRAWTWFHYQLWLYFIEDSFALDS